MAKSIRLLNVDYIVTSSDKIIDLNDILGNTNSWVIDGAAKSATMALSVGGYTSNGLNTSVISSFNFADNSQNNSWGSTTIGIHAHSGSSSGTQWMHCIGMNRHSGSPQWYTNIVVGNFSSGGNAANVGSMTAHGYGGAALSDGTDHYNVGGNHGHTNVVHNHIERIPYSSTSTSAASIGSLSEKKANMGATCDHDNGYIFGGMYAIPNTSSTSTAATTTTKIEKFSCSSGSASHENDFTVAVGTNTTAGNGTVALRLGYRDSGWTNYQDVAKYHMSSNAVNDSFGTLSNTSGLSGNMPCSTGTDILFNDGLTWSRRAFDYNATSTNYSSHTAVEKSMAGS
jgi:hypothetical protein